jgi:uncharacterized membrane protein YciS (DUF1049 family)
MSGEKRVLNPFKNKKFKYGGLSALFTVMFAAGIIMVNIIAGMLLDRFDAKLDLTANRIFTIEDSTVAYLKDLDDNVTVTVASRETEYVSGGVFYNQANEIIKRFAAASPRVKAKYADLMSDPVFASKHGNSLTPTSIVVESERTGRSKVLSAADYISVEYYDYQNNRISAEEYQMYMMYGMSGAVYANYGAAAENALLSAFLSVTNVSPVLVGITSGYSEIENASLINLLENNAYIVRRLNLTTDEIPGDMDFIIVNSPDGDFAESVLAKLEAWLDNGGKYGKTLFYATMPIPAETPRIDSFLYDWGIEVGDGYVVQTSDNTTYIMGNQTQRFEPANNEYAAGLNPNYSIYAEYIRPINALFEAKSNIETRALLASYDGAVVFPFEEMTNENSAWDPSTAEQGRYDIIIESRKTRYEEFTPFSSRVIVLGGYELLLDYYIEMGNANNARFFMNIVNFISGKDGSVTLTPKSFLVASFNISAGQSSAIGFIFAVALPLAIIVTGTAIWLKRRYR